MNELLNILRMSDRELGGYLRVELRKFYKRVYSDNDNYLYVKGTAPMCLVAHIDTVCNKVDLPVILKVNHNLIENTKGILGADDRAGVYGILEIVRELHANGNPLPSVLFTNYEESGGRGVKAFIATGKFDPRGIDLLVELDRRGCNEYVFYSTTLPVQVKNYVESFGFREERGSYSDISDLTDTYEIPSVNLSIGYYNQHTMRETLHYDELMLTVDRVVEMCEDPIGTLYKVPKPTYKKWSRKDWDEYGGYCGGIYTPPKNPAITHNLSNVPKAKTTEAQSFLDFEHEINKSVVSIVYTRKEEIKNLLLSTSSLDTVGEDYLEHEYAVSLIELLADLESLFIGYVMTSVSEVAAFHRAWNETVECKLVKYAVVDAAGNK